MEKLLGKEKIGTRGTVRVTMEDEWIYPEIEMTGYDGESSVIRFQHTSSEQLRAIAEMLISAANQAER